MSAEQGLLEKYFGIIRQFCCNGHPTAAQFLLTGNCLRIYDLDKAHNTGNCEWSDLIFLLSSKDANHELDSLLDNGKVEEAFLMIKEPAVHPTHEYPQKKRLAASILHGRVRCLQNNTENCVPGTLSVVMQPTKNW